MQGGEDINYFTIQCPKEIKTPSPETPPGLYPREFRTWGELPPQNPQGQNCQVRTPVAECNLNLRWFGGSVEGGKRLTGYSCGLQQILHSAFPHPFPHPRLGEVWCPVQWGASPSPRRTTKWTNPSLSGTWKSLRRPRHGGQQHHASYFQPASTATRQ